VNDDVTILNCITQQEYGKDGRRYVSYDAVDDCMKSIAKNMMMRNFFTGNDSIHNESIHMPKIGAGLGGGEWSIIEAIINHHLKDHQVIIYEI
jgi:hypothetical protein